MLTSLPAVIFVGVILGYLSSIGVGGGSLLMLWLTLYIGMDSQTAATINLMFFITAAGSVSFFRWRKGTLHLRKILPAVVSGGISAALFSLLGKQFDHTFIEKLFGFLLLGIGLRELCYRPRKAK